MRHRRRNRMATTLLARCSTAGARLAHGLGRIHGGHPAIPQHA
ncbi:hypothetical protein N802_13360 [Knoellia sinensis KCTC 19936]|uniref:Uncharacterized protein n=1 Tax=Knoellia sinensis KCTC 19936 TaxID=1385520 RepID=A0A0A0JFS1_9MICO|nr:hypothetical protein N802_13360 [Knoellia sinensis KCTC 19936]